jgi:hypothetical protein
LLPALPTGSGLARPLSGQLIRRGPGTAVAEYVRLKLQEAWEFLRAAEEQFKSARSEVEIRDAAEKAWGAVVHATDALVYALSGRKPLSHFERRRALRELEEKVEAVRRLGLRDRYMARYKALHETFYEGVVDREEIRLELEKARRYVEDVERSLGRELSTRD